MAPFIIQLISFIFLFLLRHFWHNSPKFLSSFSSRAEIVSIAILFIVTGISHFTLTESMASMFPNFIPYKIELVYLSGIFELLIGLALLLDSPYRSVLGGALIMFLILSLPINVYSALYNVGLGAKGINYLYFRIPLQFFWGLWIWFFIVRDLRVKL